jgi:hypothetical protein
MSTTAVRKIDLDFFSTTGSSKLWFCVPLFSMAAIIPAFYYRYLVVLYKLQVLLEQGLCIRNRKLRSCSDPFLSKKSSPKISIFTGHASATSANVAVFRTRKSFSVMRNGIYSITGRSGVPISDGIDSVFHHQVDHRFHR